MRRRRFLAAVAVVAVTALTVAGVLAAKRNGAARPVAVDGGARVVRLSGSDPVTGAHVDLASYAGRPIVLNVWSSWCTGCKAEAASLRAFALHHPSVVVVGLDLEDTTGAARASYRRWRWRHPSIADPHGSRAAELAITGAPTTLFLDARHQIVARVVGATDRTGFEDGLRAARERS